MIPTVGAILLLDSRIIAVADQYPGGGSWTALRRYCHHCEISDTARRCFLCGRFTTAEVPPDWHKAGAQTYEEVPGGNHASATCSETPDYAAWIATG